MSNNGFNPIKEDSGGIKAKRAIWTTKAIELAIKGLGEGRRLIANPFYENNIKLLKGDLVFQRTKEEVKEWQKCRKDVIYFSENYCKLMTPEGIKNIQLRDYQVNYLKHLQDNRLSIMLSARQAGKCVSFLTRISIRMKGDGYKKWSKYKYINKNDDAHTYYDIPLYEVYNMYDYSLRWKILYLLYKTLDRLES